MSATPPATGSFPSVSQIKGELGALGDKLAATFKPLLPEESPPLQDMAETLVNTTIKTGFNTVKAAISPVTSAASSLGVPGVPLITNGLNSIISMIDGIVQLATVKVPEDKLDAAASMKINANGIIAGMAGSAKNAAGGAESSAKDALNNAKDMFNTQKALLDQQANGAAGAFKNMKPPKLPVKIQQELEDLQKSVMQVVTNIPNIMIGILFGLIGQIFDAFNQIVGVIGVPSLPAPLSQIMTLIPSVTTIFQFIMGLPMSLVTLVKAVLIKKLKVLYLGLTPPAALPKFDMPSIPADVSPDLKLVQDAELKTFAEIASFKVD